MFVPHDSMLLCPQLSDYRFAVYSRGHLMDLTTTPQQPVALFSNERIACSYGARMWPTTFTVVDLGEVRHA